MVRNLGSSVVTIWLEESSLVRALVTGGYGYIGGHLVLALLREGWDVTVMDTMFNSKSWDFGYGDKLYTLNASVCNPDAVSRAVEGIDIVYHLAARMDWSRNPRHPVRLFHTNVNGTVTLLSVANVAGVDDIVFASSAAVYGNVVGAEEWGPANPVNLYGCSKLAAEQACRHYQNIGMNVKILRLYNVWGGAHSSSVVNKFVAGEKVVYEDGLQTRDFIHISDVIGAMLSCRSWEPSVYNIGTGEEITIQGLWDKLNPEEEPEYKDTRGFVEISQSCACMDNTFMRVGWRPEKLLSELSAEDIKLLCS